MTLEQQCRALVRKWRCEGLCCMDEALFGDAEIFQRCANALTAILPKRPKKRRKVNRESGTYRTGTNPFVALMKNMEKGAIYKRELARLEKERKRGDAKCPGSRRPQQTQGRKAPEVTKGARKKR